MALGRHPMGVAVATLTALVMGLSATSALAEGADLARGEVLFDLCSQCHGEQAEGVELFVAPSIAGLDLWYLEMQLSEFRTGLRGQHFDDITGMRMRPMSLTLKSEEDVKAVAAYVASLPKVKPEPTITGGDAAKGKEHYQICGSCHGPNGDGIEAQRAPAINHSQDWYLTAQVEKFQAGVRGSDPKDSFGVLMMTMSRVLPDDQALRDVIAYIMTLGQ